MYLEKFAFLILINLELFKPEIFIASAFLTFKVLNSNSHISGRNKRIKGQYKRILTTQF